MYHQAIEAATKAIEKNPKNREAYFSRALAYFETGNFDAALADFHVADKKKDLAKMEHKTTNEFRDALFKGLIKYTAEGFMECLPSLAHTAYGLTNTLWTVVTDPLDSSLNFANACYEASNNIADYLLSINLETIQTAALQMYQNYEKLGDSEKGDLIASIIGKYGVDIFAGSASLKCINSLKKLKEANAISNLEALAKTEATKKAIIEKALKHRSVRQDFFANAKIHWDKQNKHIPGKQNFEVDRGIVTIDPSKLEPLLKQHAGSGQKIIGEFGVQGYKERVEFGQVIGEYALKAEGQPTKYFPTTKGIITYGKDGKAHIYPANPNSW